ncbi:MAG: hypothetical protein HZA92_05965 [Verrucomicrobia bacterium]|nr:hypothetical protein [Verrucomicrobiota bacterium]
MKSYMDFLRELGRSRVTGFRWARRGWLSPVRIAGRLYITDEEIQRFIQRAERGEFAKVETPLNKGLLSHRTDGQPGQVEDEK